MLARLVHKTVADGAPQLARFLYGQQHSALGSVSKTPSRNHF